MIFRKKKPEPPVDPYVSGYQIAFPNIENSKWGVQIASGFVIRPRKGKEANWFHRIMQRLILGFVWKKYE